MFPISLKSVEPKAGAPRSCRWNDVAIGGELCEHRPCVAGTSGFSSRLQVSPFCGSTREKPAHVGEGLHYVASRDPPGIAGCLIQLVHRDSVGLRDGHVAAWTQTEYRAGDGAWPLRELGRRAAHVR